MSRLTKTQKKTIATLEAQLTAAKAARDTLLAAYADSWDGDHPTRVQAADTINGIHDLITALESNIHIEGLPIIPASEQGTARLVALNID